MSDMISEIPSQMHPPRGFDALAPKTAFFLGLGTGVLGLFTIGFFVLLVSLVGGGSLHFAASTGTSRPAAVPSVAAAAAPSQPTAPSQPSTQPSGTPPAVTSKDHIRGPSNAKVTLIEYSDFECPFCKRFAPTTAQVLQAYAKDVRLIYRHFPLSFHQNAQKEAEAAECVTEQGGNDAFWKFHDAIFARTTSNGTGFALDKLGPLAKELGLDQTKFQQCLDSGKYASAVQASEDAASAVGVNGTPGTFVLGPKGQNQLIPGALPFDSIKPIIDSMLQ